MNPLTPAPKTAPEPLAVGTREAAAMLGVSVRTLATLTTTGAIPSLLIGRRRLYRVEALRAFLAAREGVRHAE